MARARSLSESVDTFQKCEACEAVESKDSSWTPPCGCSPPRPPSDATDMGTYDDDEDDDDDTVVVAAKASGSDAAPLRVIMLLT